MSIIRMFLVASLAISTLLLSASCASHRSAVSIHDADIFMDRPKIVESDTDPFLEYRYAKYAFLMSVDSGIEKGNLVFYVPGMTSTGSPGGRSVRVPILGDDRIALARGRRVFWKEPDGSLIPLRIVKTAERR